MVGSIFEAISRRNRLPSRQAWPFVVTAICTEANALEEGANVIGEGMHSEVFETKRCVEGKV
jgi:hypothetical protein